MSANFSSARMIISSYFMPPTPIFIPTDLSTQQYVSFFSPHIFIALLAPSHMPLTSPSKHESSPSDFNQALSLRLSAKSESLGSRTTSDDVSQNQIRLQNHSILQDYFSSESFPRNGSLPDYQSPPQKLPSSLPDSRLSDQISRGISRGISPSKWQEPTDPQPPSPYTDFSPPPDFSRLAFSPVIW